MGAYGDVCRNLKAFSAGDAIKWCKDHGDKLISGKKSNEACCVCKHPPPTPAPTKQPTTPAPTFDWAQTMWEGCWKSPGVGPTGMITDQAAFDRCTDFLRSGCIDQGVAS